ncbi:hypothetical protein [Thermogutta sp.]|uniref:ImuA family protein n=1 Tax=Thermogutta sp. TaxID=1962930 RepID=UPI00321F6B99
MASIDFVPSSADSLGIPQGNTFLGSYTEHAKAPPIFSQQTEDSRSVLVAVLRRQIEAVSSRRAHSPSEGISIDIPEVDALLPQKRIFPGGFVEWLIPTEGIGGECLSLRMAWSIAVHRKGHLVIVDPTQEIYPPGLVYLGIDLSRTIFLHPTSPKDASWAIIQVLRCSSTGALWARIDRLDTRTARRFQLAAEQGFTVGIFVRPFQAINEISWAQVRFLVQPQAATRAQDTSQRRRVKVIVVRARGQWENTAGEVLIDDPADPLSQTFGTSSLNESPSLKAASLRA